MNVLDKIEARETQIQEQGDTKPTKAFIIKHSELVAVKQLVKVAIAVSEATHDWNQAVRKIIRCEVNTGIDLANLDSMLALFGHTIRQPEADDDD